MRSYRREILKASLREIFSEQDALTVLAWMSANDGRRPVVLVGAGFTLNALNARTRGPVKRGQVPLWSHLITALASDLDVKAGEYPAPQLAEIYAETIGKSELERLLMSSLDDEGIVPGPAHDSLFAFDCEAIVTTNHLDTMLDRSGNAWTRVIRDSDLAMLADRYSRQVIYFHGHRSDPSGWVFTRGQYEDIERSRPIIVTKVRQLLAQFPLLIVGYSLQDPDFHQIYRHIGRDMGDRHPRSLAVFLAGNSMKPVEAEHWRRHGIHAVSFREGDIGASFSALFRAGSAPTDSKATLLKLEETILAQSAFSDRLAMAMDFLGDPDRDDDLEADSEWPSRVWWAVAEGAIHDPERRASLNLAPAGTPIFSRDAAGGGGQRVVGPHAIAPSAVPAERFDPAERICRTVDRLLSGGLSTARELARWMAAGLDTGPVRRRHPVMLDMHSWLWMRSAVQDGPAEPGGVGGETAGRLRQCYELAVRYGHAEVVRRIIGDCNQAGLPDPEPPEIATCVQTMGRAFDSLQSGDAQSAVLLYSQAAQEAAVAGRAFEEWVALRGRADASAAVARGRGDDPAERRELRRRLDALEQTKAVRDWLSFGRNRIELVRQAAERETHSRARAEQLGERAVSINKFRHELWTCFKDLESCNASPQHQAEFLQPLLVAGALDPSEELRYRIRLDIGVPQRAIAWLDSLSMDGDTDLEGTRARDAGLAAELLRGAEDLPVRLRLIPATAWLMSEADVVDASHLIRRCRAASGLTSRRISSQSFLVADYAAAWRAVVATAPSAELLGEMWAAARGSQPAELEFYTDALAAMALPDFLAWFPEAVISVLCEATRQTRSQDRADAPAAASRHLVSAMSHVATHLAVTPVLQPAERAELAGWLDHMLRLPPARDADDALYAEALAARWGMRESEADSSGLRRVGIEILDALLRHCSRSPSSWAAAVTTCSQLLDHVAPAVPRDLEARALAILSLLDSQAPGLVWHVEHNPHLARPFALFLTQRCFRGAALVRAHALLRKCTSVVPWLLAVCVARRPELASDRSWDWHRDQALAASAGQGGSSPLDAREAAALTFDTLARHGVLRGGVPRRWGFLRDFALCASRDRSLLLALRGTAGLIAWAASTRVGHEAHRLAEHLRATALDPRVRVRSMMSFAAGRLGCSCVGAPLRELAAELRSTLSAERYAEFRTKIRAGERRAALCAAGGHRPRG
jgi:hypothetical protein